MRTQALILLVPVAVFLMETASYIPAMQENCAIVSAAKSTCTKTKQQGECQTSEKTSCSKMKKQDACSNQKESNKKPCDNKCKDNPDCTSCPVCYNFIFQPQYEWAARAFIFKKNYHLLMASYISIYASDVWKPPNGFTYFS